MAAEKKNPYVMTIGFRKDNPEHIQVAEFLNSLEREKAQYIVKAVLTYRTLEEKGEVPQTGGAASYDYETIKSIVLQIMREQGGGRKDNRYATGNGSYTSTVGSGTGGTGDGGGSVSGIR